MEVDEFIARVPQLFHMAEAGSWTNIARLGLLSTKATLDRCAIGPQQRTALERTRRSEKVRLVHASIGEIVLRDQLPMTDDRLRQALRDGTEPSRWYEFLNSRVFFWASRERLERLLSARAYRADYHDVLTVDTRSLLRAQVDEVLLCHMNSGNTFPMPHARGLDDFKPIRDWEVNSRGNPVKPIVEVTVGYSVPEIRQMVVSVEKMRGGEVIERIL